MTCINCIIITFINCIIITCINCIIITCINNNNNALINSSHGRLQGLVWLFKIPTGTRKDFFEICRQFRRAPALNLGKTYPSGTLSIKKSYIDRLENESSFQRYSSATIGRTAMLVNLLFKDILNITTKGYDVAHLLLILPNCKLFMVFWVYLLSFQGHRPHCKCCMTISFCRIVPNLLLIMLILLGSKHGT